MTEVNSREILNYFEKFNGFSHKFYYKKSIGEDIELDEKIVKLFYSGGRKSYDFREESEVFRTLEKVYHYGSEKTFDEMYLLEKTADEFLAQYVDIDGLNELFRSAYFYFEWMMHLEYMHKKHDYSYYRDHYLHQIRNLYEMFIFLQDMGMWRDCMEVYRQRDSVAASRMADSVEKQMREMHEDHEAALIESFGNVDEWCYHYIIFSTAIVSSIVHDIGYPITYMKRNLSALQDFLPLSRLFMGLDDGIPQIKSLLSGSLLFEAVDNDEIIRRLSADDHGAYSAIILLCQYYDNGKIFSLEPIKRMVIELSALVIYNHTLRYHFQSEKAYDRYQSVFINAPVSYLFRLCDDMQEWERVYFEITGEGTFFICDKCKMPMLRCKNPKHRMEADIGKGNKSKTKRYEYVCGCGAKGINTVWFPYRRMMNVAPFTEAILVDVKSTGKREEQKWILELKCDKGALLQLASYNPNFAIQRAKGIRELKGLLRGQKQFPRIFVKAFVSCNPIALKVEILKEFLQQDKVLKRRLTTLKKEINDMEYGEENIKDFQKSLEAVQKIRDGYLSRNGHYIYEVFEKKYYNINGENWAPGPMLKKQLAVKFRKSIRFYLFLLLFCELVCNIDFESRDSGNIDNKSEKNKREKYELKLNDIFMQCAEAIAQVWKINDPEMIDLISDCFACMYGNISENDFFEKQSTFRYGLRIPLREDMKEILKKYTRRPNEPITPAGKSAYDYYSDYYFFYTMDCLNSRR